MTISPKDPRDAEPVVEDQGVVPGVVPRPAHLHDAELALHPEFALPGESQVHDSVRWQLSQQEGRALEVSEPPNQGEHLLSGFLELRQDLERVEGVKDEETIIERLAD